MLNSQNLFPKHLSRNCLIDIEKRETAWTRAWPLPCRGYFRSPPNSVVAGAATSGTGIAPQTVMAGTAIVLATAAEPSCALAIPAAGKAAAPAPLARRSDKLWRFLSAPARMT